MYRALWALKPFARRRVPAAAAPSPFTLLRLNLRKSSL
jgi:hypothetical protein